MTRIKKEDHFYTMLRDLASKIVEAADEYKDIICEFPESIARIPQMKVYETECDEKVKRIMENLYTSFITPFEREDISDLALALDDIVDMMNGVVVRLDLFNISDTREEAPQLAELTVRCVGEVYYMIDRLPNFKSDRTVMDKAIMISSIEDEGDIVYSTALRRLFRDEENGRTSVTWLRLFDRMELCLDACDKSAGVVRSVVMKSA